ncbi:hypothetical protein OsccyDRAFT_4019 [Leptolyngbyaceae cyanobacterium JSC-12]|nr:hypothetical protein OsccyDRAFT_4019 [Leptolyngbyaceae cyanobacterium JSC-12]
MHHMNELLMKVQVIEPVDLHTLTLPSVESLFSKLQGKKTLVTVP